ncbi:MULTISPECIES: aldehyde dehydrogenase family protein [Mycolicibacterium]|jgi:aldehyde dehydrogenase (NAD+)|uniref:Aldehyde dehydrogenase family protein n=3 Tax=Mycolicibacterium TaxID=1866885 RepID=A0AAE4VH35_MYCFO|nr:MULTISPECIES: aldehyde dehydrogenase family protein [Mycolicibacterium]MCV7142402.1 aldehyde dehydrogenase family protein [Mycolicibacterium fortuitum]MDV7194550.1 aldehyde dehydrogenase family protein [Mycolicibacterium fortuitum]MDV7208112.1 aldehyde dehydrogenase family protein [Mycolicibacterium fortuitum]MDV7230006.1 aldehyde dehydrogenase family protein [Mycolicibacterium fortuitum]MDV7261811.1 aldehyde dehydrogenase family protein [Mycolicibacterium fortuitum]
MTASPTAAATVNCNFNPEARLLINGELREAATGQTADNLNPATEEVLGVTADAGAEDMDEAIAAARHAFDTTDWSTNRALRQRCLIQLHEALQEEKEDIRAELIAEVGATVGMTYIAQLEWPLADAIRYPAELISSFQWERMLAQDAKMGVPYNRVVVKEPMGVVGAITPWNFPFEIISNKIGQVLATGNTMVLKPAIETPWSALRWGRIIAEKTDIPAGVVNIVTTSDNGIAQRLVTDPRVDMISFTGSTAVGQLIQRLSGDTMKRNMLELGGKSAYLILDDADMNMALPGCIGALMHSGQGCALATRMLVPRSHYDQAVEVATATFGALAVGNPADPNTFCGPLVSAKQRDRVLNYVEIAKAEGGRVTVGGGVPEGLARGFFVAPTVVADVAPDHTIFQEEVFGPVLSITPYDGGDDGAVEMANNSKYGLAGGIMGSNERAMAVARRIRTGSLMINSGMYYGADAPFGGYKMSGIGRQNGIEGFEQHLQTKTIGYPLS